MTGRPRASYDDEWSYTGYHCVGIPCPPSIALKLLTMASSNDRIIRWCGSLPCRCPQCGQFEYPAIICDSLDGCTLIPASKDSNNSIVNTDDGPSSSLIHHRIHPSQRSMVRKAVTEIGHQTNNRCIDCVTEGIHYRSCNVCKRRFHAELCHRSIPSCAQHLLPCHLTIDNDNDENEKNAPKCHAKVTQYVCDRCSHRCSQCSKAYCANHDMASCQ
jgi:hypothetical protein